ncbi:hypothetical protein HPP92_021300 [Vanilla planifolia]|uniref:ABC transmembrane type-1 domain-containing protein n=1 Tax=Vanilla planifolia TaxID=51239 RepID=A0A835Q1Q5_VANPL|nr:hypothetical protein HPP92_021744 [Vanilla planifolia]KAG0462824.1 hypothetical protein HPP92_021300 [Vanilla planifolia]
MSGSLHRSSGSFGLSFRSSGQVEHYCDDHDGNEEAYQGKHGYGKERKQVSFLKLASLNKHEFPVLALGSFAATVNGLIFPLFGVILSSAIKAFYEPPYQLQKDARFWSIMYALLGAIAFFVTPMQHYWFGVAGGKLIERIRSLSFERTVQQEISWFDEPANSSWEIVARLSLDAAYVKGLVGDTLSLLVQNTSTVIAGLVIAFAANWKLSLVILGIIPLIGLQAFIQMKFLKGFSSDAKVMYEEASQVASDAVTSIRTVVSFCAEDRVLIAYQNKCKPPVRQGIQKGIIEHL